MPFDDVDEGVEGVPVFEVEEECPFELALEGLLEGGVEPVGEGDEGLAAGLELGKVEDLGEPGEDEQQGPGAVALDAGEVEAGGRGQPGEQQAEGERAAAEGQVVQAGVLLLVRAARGP
jgi:hypothetical protein